MYYVPDGTKECGFYECKKLRQSIPVPADDERIHARTAKPRLTMKSVRMSPWKMFLIPQN